MATYVLFRTRVIIFLAAFTCAFSLAPIVLGVQVAQSAPALDVTFDESTGQASWTPYPEAGSYQLYYEETTNPDDGLYHGSTTNTNETSANFKDLIDTAVTEGYVQIATQYVIKVQACDSGENPIAGTEWSYTYNYTPTKTPVEGVAYNSSTGMLTWTAPTGAHHYYCFIKGSSSSLPADANSINIHEAIDTLITNGFLAKPADNKYAVTIIAYNASNAAIAASEAKTIEHASSATSMSTGALPVEFNAATGAASWSA